MSEIFRFEVGETEAVLTEYMGEEASVRVPEFSDGKRVVSLGRYAFAENRNLSEVFLPDGVRCLGRHVFYNCRNLKKISVPGGLFEVGDGAFKNCERLSELELRKAEPGNTCLKHLVFDQNHALHVKIQYAEKTGSEDTAALYFPDFEYEYIANEPARIFNEVGYGAGYLYQQCFFDKDVDYERYDGVFSSAVVSEGIETLSEIALLRLGFPYRLGEMSRRAYEEYLRGNVVGVVVSLLEKERWDGMRLLGEIGVFSEDMMPGVIEEVRGRNLMKGVAWLLHYQKERFGRREKKFEL
jgi:hypothetical protein